MASRVAFCPVPQAVIRVVCSILMCQQGLVNALASWQTCERLTCPGGVLV